MAEITHQKLHLAKEQLDVALDLFMNGRSHVSALVLASNAEDILAKILSARGIKASGEQSQCVVTTVDDYLRRQGLSWHKVIADKQQTQIAARNATADSGAVVSGDLEDAALWMLVRAYDNYKRLGLQASEKVRAFDQWLRQGLESRAA